ncbi:conserved hypothetical protein [Rippkaea orientalis PCC 8801]|uniref:Type II toxin-antitoxin system HigB family toxin n=1 Tax=Rippkaea orientalis (strain PCC 8801 / RF-1) TaxID=41431 RepID=B7JXQ4_RIPO1|nr:type II toxin-antitoxin system HigB family toxin [Rippkaea orientalis]ACK64811.1 conserved hypothetical protein [Rippkaea orientalis PCC 8801]
MELIRKAQLRNDASKYGDTKRVVEEWISIVKDADWNDITKVRKTYPSADYVKGKTVFNIKGNSYRLITIIDYSLKLVVYETFLTHADYDKYQF